MPEILQLSIPWWEVVLRGSVVYFALMLLLRLSGKRTVGQFTPFDLLVLVLLGDAVQGSMIAGDESLPGGLLLAGTLLGWNHLVGIAARHRPLARLIEGKPLVLAHNGHVYKDALRRANVSLDDLQEAMRQADCASINDVRVAMLEKDGCISIVTRKD